MPHVFIVDKKKWEEAQKRSDEFWSSEEGQKLKQDIHDLAPQFEELRKTGKTTVRVIVDEEAEVSDEEVGASDEIAGCALFRSEF